MVIGGGLSSVGGLLWRGGGVAHTCQCEMPIAMMFENTEHLEFQSVAFQLAVLREQKNSKRSPVRKAGGVKRKFRFPKEIEQ